MSIASDIKDFFKKGDSLTRLLLVNGGVFIGLQVLWLVAGWMKKPWEKQFGSDLFLGSTSSPELLLERPWSILTHMFTQLEFGHFFFNMIMLYASGRLFQHIIGSGRLTTVYLLGGFSGFFLYFLFYNLFPAFDHHSMIVGASSSILAIFIAVAMVEPERKVSLYQIFVIRLKWLAVLFVLLDLWSLRKGENTGGHIGHLGGALFGLIYGRSFAKGKPMGEWVSKLFTKRSKLKVAQSNPRMKSDDEFNTERLLRQKKVDEILDKISRNGYDNLTKEEKDFLFKNSQK